MEEMVDLLDSVNGEKTGEIVSKTMAHQKGLWHGAVHLFLLSQDRKKILLQKRCALKKLYPNMWDISVGGHIVSSEDSLTAVKRELSEELGLSSAHFVFEKLGRIQEEFHYEDIFSREFVTIYLLVADVDLAAVSLQQEEVSDVKWFTKKEFQQLIQEKTIIPHLEEFVLLDELLQN